MVQPTWFLFLQCIVRSRGNAGFFYSSKYQDMQCVNSSILGLSAAQALLYIVCSLHFLYGLFMIINAIKAALKPATLVQLLQEPAACMESVWLSPHLPPILRPPSL